MITKKIRDSYIRAAGATHVGLVRQSNQDNFALREGTFVLADGMGGHQGGEALLLKQLRQFLKVGK